MYEVFYEKSMKDMLIVIGCWMGILSILGIPNMVIVSQ